MILTIKVLDKPRLEKTSNRLMKRCYGTGDDGNLSFNNY